TGAEQQLSHGGLSSVSAAVLARTRKWGRATRLDAAERRRGRIGPRLVRRWKSARRTPRGHCRRAGGQGARRPRRTPVRSGATATKKAGADAPAPLVRGGTTA